MLVVAEVLDGRPNAIGSFQFLFGILEATPWPVDVLAPFLMNLAAFFSRQPTVGCRAAGANCQNLRLQNILFIIYASSGVA